MLEKEIRAHALKNALEHGKAILPKVLPKLFQHGLQKSQIKEIIPTINQIIKEVNSLPKTEQEKQLLSLSSLIPKKEIKEHDLPELKNTENLVMRFEPSPSGPLHVGHSYVLALNHLYAKRYNGKLILRIGDTNPENIYPPAYKIIPEDANWLTNNSISETIIQSDRLPLYYKYFETLLELDKVYICTCKPKAFKDLINERKSCPCRHLHRHEQKERWKKMLTVFREGKAVARLKTNLQDKNPAMRDFPLFRINDSPHERTKQKYRVWPLMNMAVAIDDLEMKITHVIRAKDHADNAKRQEIIHSYLGQKTPLAIFVGRINFLGMPLSTTKTREAIEKKKYEDWDDIRLPFLPALKRRGFQPEALLKYAKEVGITLTDKTVQKEEFFKSINHFNRENIDEKADRYFFISKPKKIRIKKATETTVKIPFHPDFPERGLRKFKVKDEFYIEDKLERNKNYRLMHLLNFKNKEFISSDLDPELNAKLIQWLPVSKDSVKADVLMENGKHVKGIVESDVKKLKVGEIIQFERFGFVRLDKKMQTGMEFWWLHK